MGRIEFNKKRILFLVGAVLALYILIHGLPISADDYDDVVAQLPVPESLLPTKHKPPPSAPDPDEIWDLGPEPSPSLQPETEPDNGTVPEEPAPPAPPSV